MSHNDTEEERFFRERYAQELPKEEKAAARRWRATNKTMRWLKKEEK